jgi:hypothetical protein
VGRLTEYWNSGSLGQSYSQCCKACATQSEPSNQGLLVIVFVELKIGCNPGCPCHEQDSTGFEDGEQHFLFGPEQQVQVLVRNEKPVFELGKCNFPSHPQMLLQHPRLKLACLHPRIFNGLIIPSRPRYALFFSQPLLCNHSLAICYRSIAYTCKIRHALWRASWLHATILYGLCI